MSKIVILGCGYIGTNLANYIVENSSEEIYIYGIYNEYNNYLNKKVSFVEKRIEQIGKEDRDVFDDSIVIDAVGNTNATNRTDESSILFLHNCSNKVSLIERLNELGIKKYIFLSSGGTVYDDSKKPHIENESVNPKTIYALEKVIIEDYISIYAQENNHFNYLILRLSNPYGGIVSKNKKQGIIDVAINKAINGEELELYGDLENVRDYIYILDIVEYIYKLSISSEKNEIINVGTGEGKSLFEIFQMIEKVFGKKVKYREIKTKTCNISYNVLDVSKMKRIINISRFLSIEEGINLIKKYIENNK